MQLDLFAVKRWKCRKVDDFGTCVSAVSSCLDVLDLCIRNIGDTILKHWEDKSSGIGGGMLISIESGRSSNLTSSSQ